jgi:hypothetical protein
MTNEGRRVKTAPVVINHALNRPEVMISNAAQRFDAQGTLTDETTQDPIRQLLHNLVDWPRQLRESVVKR